MQSKLEAMLVSRILSDQNNLNSQYTTRRRDVDRSRAASIFSNKQLEGNIVAHPVADHFTHTALSLWCEIYL